MDAAVRHREIDERALLRCFFDAADTTVTGGDDVPSRVLLSGETFGDIWTRLCHFSGAKMDTIDIAARFREWTRCFTQCYSSRPGAVPVRIVELTHRPEDGRPAVSVLLYFIRVRLGLVR